MPVPNPTPLRIGAATVKVRMFPTPRSMGESRQVLAALQKFGEVATFKNLNYEMTKKAEKKRRPVIAVFGSPDAAQKAIASSPITVALAKAPPITTTPELHQSTSNTTSDAIQSAKESSPETITCVVEADERWPHFAAIRRNPYYLAYKSKTPNNEVFQDMVDPKSGTPLKELREVLQSNVESMYTSAVRQDLASPEGPKLVKRMQDIRVENKNWGAESLMGLHEGRTGRTLHKNGGDAVTRPRRN